MTEQCFNYSKEKKETILCLDLKSFYASVECVERGLDPLTSLLVVMSQAENSQGLALATSPRAKQVFGLTNVSRRHDIPYHPELLLVPPRMDLYIEKNIAFNNILRQYVRDDDLHLYSIDESFIRIDASKRLFNLTPYEFAKAIQASIYHELGLYCTIGIGDNLLLSKLALDNAAKHQPDMIATWRYEDVPHTVWKLKQLTDFWGIGSQTAKSLKQLGIFSVYDLAHYDFFKMKDALGVIGQQLIAHAWGIDRTDIATPWKSKETSLNNSQILKRDYHDISDIKVVLYEMVDHLTTRLRQQHYQCERIQLSIGYAPSSREPSWSRQLSIHPTDLSPQLKTFFWSLLMQFHTGAPVRKISVTAHRLTQKLGSQLDLFDAPEVTMQQERLVASIDQIRQTYGFDAIVHASSHLEAGTAIYRSQLTGGHASGRKTPQS